MKVQKENFDDVFYLCLTTESPEEFSEAIKNNYGSFLLKDDTAKALYGALRGIVNKIKPDAELDTVLADETPLPADGDEESIFVTEASIQEDKKRALLRHALVRMTFGHFPNPQILEGFII